MSGKQYYFEIKRRHTGLDSSQMLFAEINSEAEMLREES
jgi:hypothetical protein